MLVPLQKTAIFLLMVGLDRGRSIIALMDSSEIKTIVAEIGQLSDVAAETQEAVWSEFSQLGYEVTMNPSAALCIIRSLFNGSKISDNSTKQFF
jgi:flagellar motor switch protein FliG